MSSPKLNAEWLELEKRLGSRPVLKGNPQEMIRQFDGLMALLASSGQKANASVVTKDILIEGIKCRIYTPGAIKSGCPLPLGVYTHGGGFICGDLESEDALCRAISEAAPCVVVSVDYRLGPRYKLPVMLQDALAVYRWAWDNASQLGGDQSKFFTVGGSAGGALALSIANHYAQHPDGRRYIHGVAVMAPVTLHWDNCPEEYREDYRSYEENAEHVPIIDRASMQTFFEAVNASPSDSSIFTALSAHHRDFPPTFICTCGTDPLRDDGRVMRKALAKAGVRTKFVEYPDLPHYFWMFQELNISKEFVIDLVGGVKWVISEME
ncbi:carboxylesterase [Penicillium canariense]|uniref:Carboxylesterase n=1 Tax=Penicillium canariense TaxID=189055 RepID=A0A9W9LGV3_9EURO|nr:carboxylesterase [Penicillium canariense]KAJ5153545.1 carboxylesterase [Penicillium canariense]